MPRPHSYPPTTSQTQKLEIAALRKEGYLQAGSYKFTVCLFHPWTGEKNGEIDAELVMSVGAGGYLRLCYVMAGQQIDYVVEIVPVPSNLGQGFYYHFRCPVSGLCAKTLYRCTRSPYFAHRTALGVKYASQYEWGAFKGVRQFFKRQQLLEAGVTRPRRKEFYAGSMTRWHRAWWHDVRKQKQRGAQLDTLFRDRERKKAQVEEQWRKLIG